MKLSVARIAIGFLFLAQASSAQRVLFGSNAYSLYDDRIVQGNFTAIATSQNSINSNYKSSDTKAQPIAGLWRLSKDVSAFPQYQSNYKISDAIYNLALEEMQNAVEPDSTFRTGKEWSGVWTRDISYSIILSMAILQPKVAMYSLMRKVKDGFIIQDTGTGGAYPVSSDRMIWAVAAYEVYKVTGDEQWLSKAYQIIKKSNDADILNIYDQQTGLVKGESSFLDWREQTYPRWMQPADIYESECLGTNVVHYQVNKVLAAMAKHFGDTKAAFTYNANADKIKQGIQQLLWQPDKGYYGQYIYGRAYKMLSPKSEALGEALSVLFDVAGPAKEQTVIQSTPVNEFGIPCIYPQIPNIPPYHNDAVWPFVETYWGLASAKAGNEASVLRAISDIYRPAALFLTNKENFVVGTGDYAGTQINSSNMLWSLSGNLALVYKIFFGMHYSENSLVLKPFVPRAFDGKRFLNNYKYRNAVLDIEMNGYGDRISSVTLDDAPVKTAEISSALTGKHKMVITLTNSFTNDGNVNLMPLHTSPETPVLKYANNKLTWDAIPGAANYRLIKNGKFLGNTKNTSFNITQGIYAEYQVVASDAKDAQSFASEPVVVAPAAGVVQIIQAENATNRSALGYKGSTGDGFVNIDTKENTMLTIPVKVDRAGVYAIDFRYANGNGPINTENKCAIRTLQHDSYFAGTVVLPQRGTGNWNEWGFSNVVKVKLEKGTSKLSLVLTDANTNMNGAVNQAEIDYVRLTRLN